MKVNIKGSITEVKTVQVDIDKEALIDEAIKLMEVDDVVRVIKRMLEARFRKNDPSLTAKDTIDWYSKKWEHYAYNDYHKNEDVYHTTRKFNNEELDYLLAIESIYTVLNN